MRQRDLATLPKAHLHLHFTGSLRPSTLAGLAAKHGIRLPETLRHHHLLRLTPDERGWFRFQRLYEAARACVRDADDMRRIVQEAAEDDAAEGSGWLELQVDPTSYAPFVGGLTAALEIILDAARTASATTTCQVAIVVAASRVRHPLDARTLARLAARYAGDGAGEVVGFGLSNDERRGTTEDFAAAFAIAARAGLASLPHSGELLGPDHIRTTLGALHPDRLGHGVRAVEDPAVLDRIVRSGVGLEVCPASNVALGVYPTPADVPLRRLVDAGARIALGADDPLLFGPRLLAQYEIARSVHHFSDADLASLARSSVEIARAPLDLRKRLLAGIDDWLASG
jgi:adenosine deaminase